MGFRERCLYLLAWRYDPPSITRLAEIASLDRKVVAECCQTLSKYGWMKMVPQSQDLRPGVLETKLDELVPHLRRGYIDTEGPYYKALSKLCNNYAEKAARERAEEEMAMAGGYSDS